VELGKRRCWHRHLAKLRGCLKERRERGQPHGRLAEVHGDLAELSGRGRSHRRLAKVHGRLTELGGRGRPHHRLAEPSERGQPHNCLAKFSLEEWQERSPTEEGDRTMIWKNGKRGVGLWPKPT
jgi:hypothetical protein